MLPYAEGNSESIISTETFVRGAYDFLKWSAWGDTKKPINLKSSIKRGSSQKKKEELYSRKLFSKLIRYYYTQFINTF